MDTRWSKPTKYTVAIGLALFGLYVFYLISRTILTLLVLAALIAFVVRPIINLLHDRLKFPSAVAVLLTYLLVVLIILISPLFLIPAITDALTFVSNLDYRAFIQSSLQWFENTLIRTQAIDLPTDALDNYVDSTIATMLDTLQNAAPTIDPTTPSVSTIISSLGSAVTVTFGVAAGLVGQVFSSIVLFIFMILSSIYMSLSAPRYRGHFMSIVPVAYRDEMAQLLNRLGFIWVAFFRGQIILMLVIGVVTWLGLTLLGVPGSFSLGIIAGLMEVIPNLGPVLAAIPGIIVALLQGSDHFEINNALFALIIVLFYWLVQNLENSIIVPKVLGEAVDLPPLVVMSGVLVGASVGGILGALLATPIIASGKEIIQYAYRKILDEEAFPAKVGADQDRPAAEKQPPLRERSRLLLLRIKQLLPSRQETPPSPPEPPSAAS